jgi:hypothetical protein
MARLVKIWHKWPKVKKGMNRDKKIKKRSHPILEYQANGDLVCIAL